MRGMVVVGLGIALLAMVVGCQSLSPSEYDLGADKQKAGDVEGAIAHYQAYIDQGEGILVALAHVRVGECYEQLGMDERAKQTYQKVVDNFAGTPEANMAQMNMDLLEKRQAPPVTPSPRARRRAGRR